MPIDFNPHIMFNTNNNLPQRIVQQSVAMNQLEKDTFTKSVKINSDVDAIYEGIKIEKKSFGTLKIRRRSNTLHNYK